MTKRYAFVLDEAVAATTATPTATCAKLPAIGNPHRHFSVFQIELTDAGEPLNIAVTPGLHSHDARSIIEELSNHGVTFFKHDDATEKRVEDWKEPKVITLKREMSGDTAQSKPMFYVDIRTKDKQNVLKGIGSYDDTDEGYLRARTSLLKEAVAYNIPYYDFIEHQILSGQPKVN